MKDLFYLFTVILLLSSCSKSPEPIQYGHDSCENCRMLISDPKYGSELITSKGKIYKFDSIECLADFNNNLNIEDISSIWVTDFSKPNEFININDGFFLKSKNLRSPMGLNLSAFSNAAGLNKIKEQYSGDEIKWDDLVIYVKQQWHEK